jgi:hypothetical protein
VDESCCACAKIGGGYVSVIAGAVTPSIRWSSRQRPRSSPCSSQRNAARQLLPRSAKCRETAAETVSEAVPV